MLSVNLAGWQAVAVLYGRPVWQWHHYSSIAALDQLFFARHIHVAIVEINRDVRH